MDKKYKKYTEEIIKILTNTFNCSIDTYRYLEENQYEKIIISMVYYNFKMVIDLRDAYNKIMCKNNGKFTQFEVNEASKEIIHYIEQSFLNLIRRGF